MEYPPKQLSQIYIYDPGDVEINEKLISHDAGLNCINQTSSAYLSIVPLSTS